MTSELLKNLKSVLRPNLMRILSSDMQEYFSTLSEYIPILLENGHPREYVESRVKEILGDNKSKEVCSWLYDWLGKNDTNATLRNNTENVKKLKLANKPSEPGTSSVKNEGETKIASPSREDEVLWPKPKKSANSNKSKSVGATKPKPEASRRSTSYNRRTPGDSSASSIYLGAQGSRSFSTDRGVSVSTDRSMSTDRGNRRYNPYPRQNQWRNNTFRRARIGALGVPSVNRPMGPLKCAVCQERFFHLPALQDHMKTHFGGIGGDDTKRRRYREAPDAYSLWFHKA